MESQRQMKYPQTDLRGNPFYLKEEDINWIYETLERMSEEEKSFSLEILCYIIKQIV